MSKQAQLSDQLKELQASACSLFEGVELAKGKLPFEIAPECTQNYGSWYSANELAKFVGNGWRLPTRKEVPLIGDFFEFGVRFNETIWTSETIDEDIWDDFDIWAVDINTGKEEQSFMFSDFGIVLVRDRSND